MLEQREPSENLNWYSLKSHPAGGRMRQPLGGARFCDRTIRVQMANVVSVVFALDATATLDAKVRPDRPRRSRNQRAPKGSGF